MLKRIFKWAISPLRSHNKGDLKIIAFCAFLAVVFWVFNSLNRNFTTQIECPIEITYDKASIMPIDKVTPSFLKMNVSSFGWALVRKGFLTNISPIKLNIKTLPENNVINSSFFNQILQDRLKGIKINSIENDTINLNLRYIAEKIVPIRVDSLHLHLSSGFAVNGHIKIEPQVVVFKGPKESMANIPDTLNIKIATKNIEGFHEEKVKIHHLHDKFLSVDKKKIVVSFDVIAVK